jgi:DNA-binding NarL/FixJ family response regulator
MSSVESPGPITIVLADDHELVRAALQNWLESNPEFAVVGAAADGNRAVELVEQQRPAIAILDIDMPGLIAFEAARRMQSASPNTKIIFLSGYHSDSYIERALHAGAAGYVTKGDRPQALGDAIRRVSAGETFFSPPIQQRIERGPEGPRLSGESQSPTAALSSRELEVLRYLAQGMAKKQIAKALSLSVGTVNNHSANLMKKLGIHDRVELTRFAIREGLVSAR